MQPYAPQGGGAIIRTGDRTSVFNSDLTYFITQQAEALKKLAEKKKDDTFKFQRALMPGGTCEATIYDAYGFKAASICVPLGNYHNMDRAKGKIGPEFIDLGDWESMVKLFVRVAREGHTWEPGMKPLKERVEKRFRQLEKLLHNPIAYSRTERSVGVHCGAAVSAAFAGGTPAPQSPRVTEGVPWQAFFDSRQ